MRNTNDKFFDQGLEKTLFDRFVWLSIHSSSGSRKNVTDFVLMVDKNLQKV